MAQRGEIIDGKYEILREIGRGGMSVVYLAMDRRLNKQWAVKEFRKDKNDKAKQVALKALLDEANLMKRLDHPTLPRIVGIIENDQNVYVIMDYIEGESLNKVLDAYGAQPQEAVIEWAKQLSDVLSYLHNQSPPVIYRDMKPANIMLKPDGTIRLIDFGIAREYKEGKDGDTEAIGTRGYAAPEQFGGKGQTDARTDIYSLGVTLYHLVTGVNPAEPPYEIYPIRHWNPSLSSGLEWLIQKCTQLNPSDRYQSCAEVTYVLENLDKFDVAYKRKQKSRINLFITSAVLTAVFAAASLGCFLGSEAEQRKSYESMIANENYIGAIELDSSNPEPYVLLSEQLGRLGLEKVINSDPTGDVFVQGKQVITVGDLDKWFPSQQLAEFKASNPEDYARIHFELGFLLWEKYDVPNAEKLSATEVHFREVISVAQSAGGDSTAGLTPKEFSLARMYYCVTFFQNHRNEFKEDKAGNTMQLGAVEEFAGIDVDTFNNSPYLSFWNTNKSILDYLNSDDQDKDMTNLAKLETLDMLAYILVENYRPFTQEVTMDEFSDLLGSFQSALDKVPDTEAELTNAKSEIKDQINNTLIPSLQGLTGTKLEGLH